jgi:O-antigen ligase
MALSSALLFLPPVAIIIGSVALTFGIFMLPLVLRRLSYAFAAWFLIVPFFPYAPELNNALNLGLANMTPERLLFILLVIIFFANICLRKVRVLPITGLEKTMVVFCLIAVISLSIHGHFARGYLGVVATRYVFPMMAFFLAKNLLKDEQEITTLMCLLFGLGAYLGITAFFEFFRLEQFILPRYISNMDFGIHQGRARGPFLQAATNGTAIGMLFFTSIYMYRSVKSSRARMLVIFLAGTMLAGVLFSLTRGAWVGTGVGLLLAVILDRSLRRYLVPAVVIGAVSLPLLLPILENPQPQGVIGDRLADVGNVYYRLNTWLAGLEMFWQHPIFGVGFARYADLNGLYQDNFLISLSGLELSGGDAAHNTYIELAAELGLIGLIPYTVIMFWCLSISIEVYRSLPAAASRARDFIVVFWGVALTYFLSSFFYTQNSMFLTSLFFTLAGVIARWSALQAMKSPSRFNEMRSLNRSVRLAAARPRSY